MTVYEYLARLLRHGYVDHAEPAYSIIVFSWLMIVAVFWIVIIFGDRN